MRLTLRTLLAYLDDILEPEDAEDINKKISESDFATSLVHRTRDCVRRVRLGTPPLEGKGLAADANTVAEYLDNTLGGERVPEFEKVCLESDVHLAEVASCHQILTLVLGEPADVKGIDRSRIYEAISRPETELPTPEPAQAATVRAAHRTPSPVDTPDSINVPKRQRPEVPDYLRESTRSRRKSFLLAMAVSAAACLALLFVAGPPELRDQLAKWTGRQETPAEPASAPTATPVPEVTPETEVHEPSVAQQPPVEASKEEVTPTVPETAINEAPVEPAPIPPREITLPKDSEPTTDAADVGSVETAPTPATRSIDNTVEENVVPVPNRALQPGTDLATEPKSEPVDEAESPANPLRPGPLDIATGLGAEVGRYMDESQVAVAFDRENNSWRRMAAKAVISSGDRIVTLPPFRPAFTLGGGTTIQVLAPSLLDFEGFDEFGIPVVGIEYGRLELLSVGKAGNKLHLRMENRDILVTFVDAQSTLAIEVGHFLPIGVSPEAEAPTLAIDLYATSGEIAVDESGKGISFKAPDHVTLTELSAANLPAGQLPEWATRDLTTRLEQIGADEVQKNLAFDRPLSLSLKELSESRRVEVRAIAIRCDGYLGDFEPFIAALGDVEQKASWPGHVESLRMALTRGPENAADVRETLEMQRGADAGLLYRMLWGYTVDQLKAGEDAKLVGLLDNDSLDIRRLAFWNLQSITGKGYAYYPEYPAARRKVPITKWRELLKSGGIVPPSPPAAPDESARLHSLPTTVR